MEAPLSSPSLPKPSHPYSTRSQTQQSQSYFNAPTSAPQQQQQQQSHQAPPQSQGPQATSHFLRDFNLVAEAAKRAQMACLMRDMEAVGLSS